MVVCVCVCARHGVCVCFVGVHRWIARALTRYIRKSFNVSSSNRKRKHVSVLLPISLIIPTAATAHSAGCCLQDLCCTAEQDSGLRTHNSKIAGLQTPKKSWSRARLDSGLQKKVDREHVWTHWTIKPKTPIIAFWWNSIMVKLHSEVWVIILFGPLNKPDSNHVLFEIHFSTIVEKYCFSVVRCISSSVQSSVSAAPWRLLVAAALYLQEFWWWTERALDRFLEACHDWKSSKCCSC